MTTNSQSFNPQELEKRIIDKAQTDATYKQQLLSNAKAVFEKELGQKLPADLEINVLQQGLKKLYVLLPLELDELARSQGLSEEQLTAIAGGGLAGLLGSDAAKYALSAGGGLLSASVLGGGTGA